MLILFYVCSVRVRFLIGNDVCMCVTVLPAIVFEPVGLNIKRHVFEDQHSILEPRIAIDSVYPDPQNFRLFSSFISIRFARFILILYLLEDPEKKETGPDVNNVLQFEFEFLSAVSYFAFCCNFCFI